MDDTLRYLIEKDAIIGTIDRLFVSADHRDWESAVACFAPQVHFDQTSLAGGEPMDLAREQIIEGWQTGLASLKAIHH